MFKIKVISFFVGILFFANGIFGLTEDTAVEEPCIQPPPVPDKNFDSKWFFQVKSWYPTFGSKEGYYRATKNLVHNDTVLAQLKEDDVAKKSCVWLEVTPDVATTHGSKGMLEKYNINFNQGTLVYSPVIKSHGTGGYGEPTLTDNQNFVFFAECWDGNQEAFKVFTKTPKIDKATEDKIWAHAKSLGFNEKFFFKVDYSQCNELPITESSEEMFSNTQEEERFYNNYAIYGKIDTSASAEYE